MLPFLKSNSKNYLAIVVLIYSASGVGAGLCPDLFTPNITIRQFILEPASAFPSERLRQLFSRVELIDKKLMTGAISPKWQDFDTIEKLQKEFAQEIQILKATKPNELTAFYKNLNSSWALQSRKNLLSNASSVEATINYGPTDYGLRKAFAEKLQELNQFLPTEAKFPNAAIPADLNRTELRKQAVEVVQNLETIFDGLLKKDIGVSSFEELVAGLKQSDATIVSALKQLDENTMQLAIQRPINGRFWVEKTGFQNQFVTNSSKGAMTHIGRNAVEASYLDLLRREYENTDNDLKPKYGYLNLKTADASSQYAHTAYGEDRYILKKDKLKSRVTFTIGDSLNSMSRASVDWYRSGDTRAPLNWDHVFIPWSRKAIIAPYIASFLSQNKLKIEASDMSASEVASLKMLKRSVHNNEYIELQFWGPLTLDDVDTFIFRGAPPTGEFLKALKDRNIKIVEHTGSILKPWKEK